MMFTKSVKKHKEDMIMAIYKTISDAAHGWVREFNAFPLGMIEKLFNAEVDGVIFGKWHI